MKPIIRKVLYYTAIYIIVFLIINIVFSVLYFYVCDLQDNSFWLVFLYAVSKNETKINFNDKALIFHTIQNIAELIASSLLTAHIFAYLLHRDVKVYLSDKLVIRYRTSEGVQGQLALGAMVMNKSGKSVENVKCYFNCSYINIDNKSRNAETLLEQKAMFVQNYHRFSFPVEMLPCKLLRDFLDKNDKSYREDTIKITVRGEYGSLGGTFKTSRTYKLSDIVFDKTSEFKFIKTYSIPIIDKEIKIKKWEALQRYTEMNETERQEVVEGIRRIAEVSQI